MRKPAFCICENKDTEQLRSNRGADQGLSFRYKDSTIPLLPESKFQASSYLLWLYSAVCVGPSRNPEDRFSHNKAQFRESKLSVTRKTMAFHTVNGFWAACLGTASWKYLRVKFTPSNLYLYS